MKWILRFIHKMHGWLKYAQFQIEIRMNRLLLLVFAVPILGAVHANLAYGHFFGASKNIDKYQVVFYPYPSAPIAGENSTLNFSILEDNDNIYNIYVAVVITDKQSGDIVGQIPYRLFEFSDISVPYVFAKPGDYTVTLQTRIQGDAKYQANPLVADFAVSALDPHQIIPFDELMLLYVTPAAAVIAGIATYLRSKNKL
jgi:hypothetical protein